MLAPDFFPDSDQVPTFVVLCYVRMQNTDVSVQEEVPELDGSGRLRPHSCLLHVAGIHRHIRLQGNQRPLHAQLSGGIPFQCCGFAMFIPVFLTRKIVNKLAEI